MKGALVITEDINRWKNKAKEVKTVKQLKSNPSKSVYYFNMYLSPKNI
jgi:hypothetical protein